MATTKLHLATRTIDRLCELDQQTTRAYYEMGHLLSTIKHGKMWEDLGYDSFAQLVEEELSYTPGTAYSYLHMYRHFNRLKYTKTEALKLLNEFCLRDIQAYLQSAKQKVGIRAIKNRIADQRKDRKEITFWMTDEEYQEVVNVLQRQGAERSETGRLLSSSEAFLRAMRLVKTHKAEIVPIRKTG